LFKESGLEGQAVGPPDDRQGAADGFDAADITAAADLAVLDEADMADLTSPKPITLIDCPFRIMPAPMPRRLTTAGYPLPACAE
jgi:hypothetical protein